MKKLFLFLLLPLTYCFSACEGPIGPQGAPGQNGDNGVNILGSVFELEGDFTADNDFAFGFDFPPDEIEVFESDVVLVYILWDVGEDSNGEALPIWRLIPQTVFLENGSFQYNYDHTFLDVNIFLDGFYDFTTLGAEWTQAQLFRVVILPADFINPNARIKVDYSNYDKVISTFKLDDTHVKKY